MQGKSGGWSNFYLFVAISEQAKKAEVSYSEAQKSISTDLKLMW